MVQNSICDGTLFDVRQVGAKFVWHVFYKRTKTTHNGECGTLEEATTVEDALSRVVAAAFFAAALKKSRACTHGKRIAALMRVETPEGAESRDLPRKLRRRVAAQSAGGQITLLVDSRRDFSIQ
jgi:hypothetical protein